MEWSTSPDYHVFDLTDENSCDKYYLYLFQHFCISRIFYGLEYDVSQLGRWRMPAHALNDFTIPCPPFLEQIEIDRYLDNVTENIDKQLLIIGLLKEYRISLIS